MDTKAVTQYINLKLAALGQPVHGTAEDAQFVEMAAPLLRNHQQKNRLLKDYSCPADKRIEDFLSDYVGAAVKLPSSFILDREGLARALSLPADRDTFTSELGTSYRVKQGVLHNPKSDRRTTEGTFHVAVACQPELFPAISRAAV